MPGFHSGCDGGIVAYSVLEFLEEHPVDLHPLIADCLFSNRRNDVGTEVLVCAVNDYRPFASIRATLALRPWKLDHLVVVVFFLEVLAVGKEVEEFVRGLLWLRNAISEAVVEKLIEEVVLAGAASLDLDKVRWREDRTEEAEI